MSDAQQPQESLANADQPTEVEAADDSASPSATAPGPSAPSPTPPSPQEAAAQTTDSSKEFSAGLATQSGTSGYTSEAGSGGEGAFGVEAEESDAGAPE